MKFEKLSLEKFKPVEIEKNSIHSINGGAWWVTAVVTAPRDPRDPRKDFDAESDWIE